MRKQSIGFFVCAALMMVPLLTVSAQQNESTPAINLFSPLDQNVTISDFQFTPDNITVPVGTKVIWTNNGPSEHTVTSDTNVFNSGAIAVGHKWNFTFNVVGSYPYHCTIHPMMHGIVIVTGGGQNLPPNKPTIDGPSSGKAGTIYNYTAVTTDPNGDDVSYNFDWGDGTNTGWLAFVPSGTIEHQSHSWASKGTFTISVKARDPSLAESPVATLSVKMPVDLSCTFSIRLMIAHWLYAIINHMFPLFEELIHA